MGRRRIADRAKQGLRKAYELLFAAVLHAVERGWLPDFVIRQGIRLLLAGRLAKESRGGEEGYQARLQAFVEELKALPIAVQTQAANEQHYEVPTSYFLLCLGKRLKYSSCLYPGLRKSTPLEDAEEAMLELCCERAEIRDGQTILELGCGWGSLCLYIAGRFPNCSMTAVSNSRSQKEFIDSRSRAAGLRNLTVVTADVVTFEAGRQFDRILSVEMFEHMKNYKALLAKISRWLAPQGLLFVHLFTHQKYAYHFEVESEDDWMAKHFFSGGTMPSANLLHYFQDDVSIQKQWFINGRHYSMTLEAWLAKQDKQKEAIMPIMKETYGQADAAKWWMRWRLFYMACSELFRYNGGNDWGVSHVLFQRK